MEYTNTMETEEMNPEELTKEELIQIVAAKDQIINDMNELDERKDRQIESIRNHFIDSQREYIKEMEKVEVRINGLVKAGDQKELGVKGVLQGLLLILDADKHLVYADNEEENNEGDN